MGTSSGPICEYIFCFFSSSSARSAENLSRPRDEYGFLLFLPVLELFLDFLGVAEGLDLSGVAEGLDLSGVEEGLFHDSSSTSN
jgi:hypothetical protein